MLLSSALTPSMKTAASSETMRFGANILMIDGNFRGSLNVCVTVLMLLCFCCRLMLVESANKGKPFDGCRWTRQLCIVFEL